tara:strand:- start:529 stop:894 length:366 start_codon:yes stop_codon:yes gene_type:complete
VLLVYYATVIVKSHCTYIICEAVFVMDSPVFVEKSPNDKEDNFNSSKVPLKEGPSKLAVNLTWFVAGKVTVWFAPKANITDEAAGDILFNQLLTPPKVVVTISGAVAVTALGPSHTKASPI